MTVAAWIESLQKFDAGLDVLVRVAGAEDSPEDGVIFTACNPSFAVDAGCTETDMLCIDMMDGDEGVDEVLALDLEKLVVKYLGGGKDNITNDEREILLFALYNESVSRGELAKRGLDVMDARLKEQNQKLNQNKGRYER